MKTTALFQSASLFCVLLAGQAHAAVTAEQANALKTNLTPMGAEKAGNKDGTIPAWTGGLTTAGSGPKFGDVPADPFPGEKPLLRIDAKNAAQYADKLSEGTRALLNKYPDSFFLEVYPTHRTAAAPQWVYDNTFANATRCKLTHEGLSVEGCYGGIPFPIPKDGNEAIWNFLLRVEAQSIEMGYVNMIGNADGSRTLASRGVENWQYPYYDPNGSADKWSGQYVLLRFLTNEPPFKAGESLVTHDSINPDTPREAWQYLVGQRRVRRAPTVGYDTPDFVASGANYFDEVQGFIGHPDRYQWKLIGKKEMYIPYNTNKFHAEKRDAVYTKDTLDSSKMRWELHRVWELEATVAPGKRHAVPKRRFYLDEDSWTIALADGYDAQGKLWRVSQVLPFTVPSIPAVVVKPVVIYNLQANTYSMVQGLNGESYKVVPRKSEQFFTGNAVASGSVR
ncbi:DUF1329 domain-containing protein [Pseudomonas aeruginosa]|uniref:DUF1329 domain-containing protein n=1 Tax=Pseudomonas aeruginosa TaxID=287 RepID=UPI000EB188AD|nr:DUF1329 domain-containing protein [Pseudomonas aeruginosa]HBO3146300.1 DUF1329 domain-containing protein [Pseudomonas aeruginosa]HCL4166294.1 DUF1329 domain-containing protein [Pseudomonas aeruginosa]